MRLLQFFVPDKGHRAGVVQGHRVIDLTALNPALNSVLTIFLAADEEDILLTDFIARQLIGREYTAYPFEELDIRPNPDKPHLLMPIFPPEVWAFGVTYQRSAAVRAEDSASNIYDRVYASERPEVFFKGTTTRCTGPNDFIGIRSDSDLTAAEPELAYILGREGGILGFTICNDVSAWDLERENPLYLPQSKIFEGGCALGPVIVTPDELSNPYNLSVTCQISRAGKVIFEGETHTSKLNRKLEELNHYLCLHNPVPFGSVVSTGTGIMIPNEHHLAEGDVVEIEIEMIGVLRNYARRL